MFLVDSERVFAIKSSFNILNKKLGVSFGSFALTSWGNKTIKMKIVIVNKTRVSLTSADCQSKKFNDEYDTEFQAQQTWYQCFLVFMGQLGRNVPSLEITMKQMNYFYYIDKRKRICTLNEATKELSILIIKSIKSPLTTLLLNLPIRKSEFQYMKRYIIVENWITLRRC